MARQVISKTVGGALLAALAITATTSRARADLGDVLIGGGAAVIIGCATGALNCKGKNKTRSSSSSSGMSSAQRQQNRDMQEALNTFGFDAGPVDGVPGRKTREAVREYQGYMGYPVTGRLNDWERQTLVDSWAKLKAGAGAAYPRTMAAVGPRSMLNIARDPNFPAQFGDPVMGGYNNQQGGYNNQAGYNNQNQGNTGWNQQQPVQQPNYQQQANTMPAPVPAPAPAPAPAAGGQVVGGIQPLQPLKPSNQAPVSAAARCELVDQTTRIQGGVIMASNMTDPNQALSEKFCEARGFAITQSGAVASKFAVSENELTSICEQIKTAFGGVMGSVGSTQPDQVLASAQTTAQGLGLSDPATATAYGQICLGIGYRLDNVDMAMAGALTLLAAGERPYGEIVGHHLREGFGVAANNDLASAWYMDAINALEQGATPVFVPSMTQERIQAIRTALQMQAQRAQGMNQGSSPQVIQASGQFPALKPIKQ